jgi:hypothetical protein
MKLLSTLLLLIMITFNFGCFIHGVLLMTQGCTLMSHCMVTSLNFTAAIYCVITLIDISISSSNETTN